VVGTAYAGYAYHVTAISAGFFKLFFGTQRNQEKTSKRKNICHILGRKVGKNIV